ncbi:hypothetical protein SLE2022_292970 [Rubroshorea leprosula]
MGGDHRNHQGNSRAPSTDLSSMLGISKTASINMGEAYKSLVTNVTKWYPDNHKALYHKTEEERKIKDRDKAHKAANGKKQVEKSENNEDSTRSADGDRSIDENFFSRPFSLAKSLSRTSRTPSARSSSSGPLSKSQTRESLGESDSHARRRPPPVEKKLDCTLEELCFGGVKRIKITKDVVSKEGFILQEDEALIIKLNPGWKKGTKVTFEGKGDEKPGYLPADIIFVIEEQRHPLFRRKADDLEIAVEIPLVMALTGCSLSVPLLGGEKISLSIEDIIYPGYEKVIQGQGMTNAKGRRGDLRATFLVQFPAELTDQQRSEVYTILLDCTYD